MNNTENFSEKESLQLITEMINKTKQSFHETGFGPIMWGGIIALCSLATFASTQFEFKLPFDIWFLTLVALIPQVIYSIKQGKRKVVKTYNDIAVDYTWISFGISMFLVSFTLNAVAYDLLDKFPNYNEQPGGFRLMNHTTAIHLMLYGIPTFITGGVMKFKAMLYGGILLWIFSLISIFTDMKIDMLLMATGVICAWLIPGLMLNARYRKHKHV